jgi:hypothetical protein
VPWISSSGHFHGTHAYDLVYRQADLQLQRPHLTVDPLTIKDIEVEPTLPGGNVVYEKLTAE